MARRAPRRRVLRGDDGLTASERAHRAAAYMATAAAPLSDRERAALAARLNAWRSGTLPAGEGAGDGALRTPRARPSRWRVVRPHTTSSLALVRPARGAHLPVTIRQLIGGRRWSRAPVTTGDDVLDEDGRP